MLATVPASHYAYLLVTRNTSSTLEVKKIGKDETAENPAFEYVSYVK